MTERKFPQQESLSDRIAVCTQRTASTKKSAGFYFEDRRFSQELSCRSSFATRAKNQEGAFPYVTDPESARSQADARHRAKVQGGSVLAYMTDLDKARNEAGSILNRLSQFNPNRSLDTPCPFLIGV